MAGEWTEKRREAIRGPKSDRRIQTCKHIFGTADGVNGGIYGGSLGRLPATP